MHILRGRGAGFENLPNFLGIKEQLKLNSRYIGKNYGSEKFIAYFKITQILIFLWRTLKGILMTL